MKEKKNQVMFSAEEEYIFLGVIFSNSTVLYIAEPYRLFIFSKKKQKEKHPEKRLGSHSPPSDVGFRTFHL